MTDLSNRFRRGVSILAQMSARWLNEVGARVSHVVGAQFIRVTIPNDVTPNTPIKVGVDIPSLDTTLTGMGFAKSEAPDLGSSPSDIRDTSTADGTDKTAVTWNAGGSDGIKLSAYVLCESSGASYWYKADIEIAKDGRVKKVYFPGSYRQL